MTRKSPLERLAPEKPAKVKKTKDVREHLTPDELKAFFRFFPKTSFWYPYFYIQYYYGCRLSEPALIQDVDVDFKKKLITIRRMKKTQDEDGYRVHIYAADANVLECIEVAQRWKAHKKISDNPFVFAANTQRNAAEVGAERTSRLRNQDGWQAVSRFTAHRMLQRVTTEIKLPAKLRQSHALRHTRAALLLASGMAEEEAMKFLGHNTLKMTQRYRGLVTLSAKDERELREMGLV